MKIIDAFNKALAWVERSLIVLLLSVMVTLAFLQVIMRSVFSSGFLWADPLLRYMVLWVGFLGAVLATREGKHFGVDFLNRFLSPKWLTTVKIFVELFAAVISYLLMRAAIEFLFEGIDATELDLFEIPKRVYFSIIPIGFGLIMLQFAINTIRHIHALFTGKYEKQGLDITPPIV